MLRNIHLYGELREKFGDSYRFDVASVAEAMRAFKSQVPGFLEAIKRDEEYAVVRGEDLDGEELTIEMCKMNYGKGDFHIVPVASGAGSSKGWIAIFVGVALLALAFFLPPAAAAGGIFGAGMLTSQTLGMLGVGLILAGIGTLLAPSIEPLASAEEPSARPSFIFTGATNRLEQGAALQLVYGQTFTGSNVIAVSYETKDI